MSYKVKFIPKFEKELKRLAKKYPSLKSDFSHLLQSLKETPTQGISLGNECYKIRMAISSKGKG
jgi:mRNA-degrading endonuclease RelE of RelBE toxin-antitoxin system